MKACYLPCTGVSIGLTFICAATARFSNHSTRQFCKIYVLFRAKPKSCKRQFTPWSLQTEKQRQHNIECYLPTHLANTGGNPTCAIYIYVCVIVVIRVIEFFLRRKHGNRKSSHSQTNRQEGSSHQLNLRRSESVVKGVLSAAFSWAG